jgi:hypothetical protein
MMLPFDGVGWRSSRSPVQVLDGARRLRRLQPSLVGSGVAVGSA